MPKRRFTTGRTISDLLSEFTKPPRAMATILMLVPFLKDLRDPLITGAILNIMWFGIPVVTGICKWIAKKLNK